MLLRKNDPYILLSTGLFVHVVLPNFHVQLSIALFFLLLVLVTGIDRTPPNYAYGGCVTVSALIQYFSLAAFMWMGAEAVLMFQKLVIVFTQITIKYIIAVSFICWCKSTTACIIHSYM